MGTTALFVELIVIGAGTTAWLAMLFLALFEVSRLPDTIPDSLAAFLVLGLPLVYLLGILADRLADGAFEALFVKRARGRYFAKSEDYYQARRTVLATASPMAELLEYGRSRMRICRGWAFNALVALAPANMLLANYNASRKAWLVTNIALFSLALLCWWCWHRLADTEYRKLKDNAIGGPTGE